MNLAALTLATEGEAPHPLENDPSISNDEKQKRHEAAQLELALKAQHEQWLQLPITQLLLNHLTLSVRDRQDKATEQFGDAITTQRLLHEAKTLKKLITYVNTLDAKQITIA